MEKRTLLRCFYFIVIAISALFILQCSQDEDEAEFGIFNIYLIHDSELMLPEFDNMAIDKIDLPKEPVTTISDIDTYKIFLSDSGLALAHSIIFKSEKEDEFGHSNCFFVLVVNGTRQYKGEYWVNFMATMPQSIIIYPYKDNEFHILAIETGIEQINDTRILEILVDYGINIIYENIGL